MAPSFAAILAAALVSAAPESAGEQLAVVVPRDAVLGAIPTEQLNDVLLEALPPPPTVILRTTRYYGTVTIDHRAHLARRASCKTCHGPGVVSKLVFTPKVAHSRCIGCHQEQAKGPTKCKECHVRAAPPSTTLVAAAAPARAEPPPPPGPNPANVAAALAAFDGPKDGAGGGAYGKEPFHRSLEVGLVAGRGAGLSVRLASHEDLVVVTTSVERMSAHADARTFGLLGAGLVRPVHAGVALEALALAGFDVVERPVVALLPAIGARAGVEWRPRFRFLKQVTASLTGVFDVSTRRALDGELGRTTVYATVATGFSIPSR